MKQYKYVIQYYTILIPVFYVIGICYVKLFVKLFKLSRLSKIPGFLCTFLFFKFFSILKKSRKLKKAYENNRACKKKKILENPRKFKNSQNL